MSPCAASLAAHLHPLRRAAPALAALVAGCLRGYDPCFLPPSVVDPDELRILAVRSDPPELVADLEAEGELEVQVRALLTARDAVTLRGRLCAPTADRRCPGRCPTLLFGCG